MKKADLPPLVLTDPRPNRLTSRAHHHASHASHSVKHKSVDRSAAADSGPRSTEESRADGNAFREALFGPTASDQEAAMGMSGGLGSGGEQSKGGGGRQKEQRGSARSHAASGRSRSSEAAADAARAADQAAESFSVSADGWMELELDSPIAGKIRLSVLKEPGLLRARLVMGNPLASQWMREHLASVEQQLAQELDCQVRLEMK